MRSTYKYISGLIILVVFTSMITSCNTSKKAGKVKEEEKKEKQKKLKSISEKKLFQHLDDSTLEYETFSAKLNVKVITKDKDQSFKAYLRIRKDSVIWLSIVPALGMELARAQLSKDSVKFINKFTSEYFVGDYDYLSEMFHVDLDYDLIQSLLLNQLFIYPAPDDSIKLKQYFKSDSDTSRYYLQSLKDRKVKRHLKKNKTEGLVDQEVVIIPDMWKIEKNYIHDYGANLVFEIKYKKFADIMDGFLFPKNQEIDVKYNKDVIGIVLKYSKVNVNKDLSFNFRIPKKYKPL